MSKVLDNIQAALQRGSTIRPQAGGFPVFAEVLRQAGITKNTWVLPACQSLFLTKHGPAVHQGTPLVSGMAEIPTFDRDALIVAIRRDQKGESSFPEFLDATWRAGVVRYDVDFEARTVTYQSCDGETYIEAYPQVSLD